MRVFKHVPWVVTLLALTFLSPSALADSDVTLIKATTLNAVARTLFPGSAADRTAFRLAVARANPDRFPSVKNPGAVPLAPGMRLVLPAGVSLPPDVAVAAPSSGGEGNAAVGALAQEAAKRGIKTCLRKIGQMSGMSARDSVVGVMFFNALRNPDSKLFSTSMEAAGDTSVRYASTTYAPIGDGDCGALHETVEWMAGSCDEFAARSPGKGRLAGRLMTQVQVLDGGVGATVFLMPAGNGCVVITKEMY